MGLKEVLNQLSGLDAQSVGVVAAHSHFLDFEDFENTVHSD